MRGDWPGVSAFLRQGDRVFHTYPPSLAASSSKVAWGHILI
jgi:hypothetical protein